ncbi:ribosome small subunit-dependent GTPase A [Paenibacillus aurantius]|uniref:Small ribosomal subunit biogenesis GTPase RsgA n=1 Tax=Paenibacillus aurantius TaxID=2918900 RepID=A0AA96LCH9_9BACL|nr:ribosome small subunit-dependent GTPase A [Paenibacillus aurantius]WNQ09710.1 ribosome small subunit-dependent GTPase A [Paenibacillus aurantius]
MDLITLGWNEAFAKAFEPYAAKGHQAGRVYLEHKHLYRVYTEQGDVLAEVTGRLRHEAIGRGDFPAVGDWVALTVREGEGRATIHGILPRFSKFSRKTAGQVTEEQIVAANVDTVFLVNALNQDFNLRRIERYLLLAWESGARPVIVLSKADLCAGVEQAAAEVEAIAPGVPVHAVSSLSLEGVLELAAYVTAGRTAALLGSSGAGKSTLINRMFGSEIMATGGIREGDDKGKHTTTHRELVVLPQGGLLIDTPGMRELQLWEGTEGLETSFRDVEELAESCRFHDCSHRKEPGCAVQEALQDGTLDQARFDSYVKLQKELAYQLRKEDKALQLAEKDKWKKIHQAAKSQRNRP